MLSTTLLLFTQLGILRSGHARGEKDLSGAQRREGDLINVTSGAHRELILYDEIDSHVQVRLVVAGRPLGVALVMCHCDCGRISH